MSTRNVLVVVAVSAMFVILAAGPRNHAQGDQQAPAGQLEYKVVKFASSKSEVQLSKQLNDLATEGWQRAFVIARESQESGNKRPDKYTRVVRTYVYVVFQRPAAAGESR